MRVAVGGGREFSGAEQAAEKGNDFLGNSEKHTSLVSLNQRQFR